MFISIKEACERIADLPAPILFLDTCIFLDIIRTPHRDNIPYDNISSALAIANLSNDNPPKLWLITNETVHGELEANIENVKIELLREIKKQEEKREKLINCVNILFNKEFPYGQKLARLQLDDHLENFSKNIMQKCLVAQIEDTHSVKAMHRVRKCLPPARKGKQEAKDCEILEAFLDLAKQIRANGVTEKIFFITSNTDDYGKPDSLRVKDEFNQINAGYINNLSWALFEINKLSLPALASNSA